MIKKIILVYMGLFLFANWTFAQSFEDWKYYLSEEEKGVFIKAVRQSEEAGYEDT